MISRGKFLCGCDPTRKQNYSLNPVKVGHTEAVTGIRRDAEGFQVCPEHGARMYGWNSPLVQHAAGQEVLDFKTMGQGKAKIQAGTVADKRDNRDPVEDHDAIMADWRLRHPRGGMNGS